MDHLSRQALAQIVLLQDIYLPSKSWKRLRRDEIMALLSDQNSCFRNFEVLNCPFKIRCTKTSILAELQNCYYEKYGTDYWLRDAYKVDRKYLIDSLFTTDPLNYLFAENRPIHSLRKLKKRRKTPVRIQRPYIPPIGTSIRDEIYRIVNSHGSYFRLPEISDEDCQELGWSSAIFRCDLKKKIAQIKSLIDLIFN